MPKREIIAYAITHAPKGVEGGPYEGRGAYGCPAESLLTACRWYNGTKPAGYTMREVRERVPAARIIRIVRKAKPSEASAVEVLRELVAAVDGYAADQFPMSRLLATCTRAVTDARAVLAASGPDPMPVVRAAMRETDAEEAFSAAYRREGSADAASKLDAATRARKVAVDAYRKAGGTAGESTVDLSDPVVKRRWLGERIAAMGGFPATRKAGGK